MRRGLITIVTLTLLLLLQSLDAQAKRKKDVEVDTVQVAFVNGFTIHADLIGAYQMLFSDHGQWEVGARINLKDRYFPAIEAGFGKADHVDDFHDQLTFKTQAPYFRVGCDFNILKNKHDVYRAFAGVRYGFSTFNYDRCIAITTTDEEGEKTTTYEQYNGLHATYNWLEGVFGVEAKIWGPLILGWDVRYRRHLFHKQASEAEPWYIPGFGGQKDAGITANFNLTIGF